MQAIGNFLLETNKRKTIFYITTEQFTNEMIGAIRANKTEAFRNKYRKIDILLVDDIHFYPKEGSQEEFSILLMLCTKLKTNCYDLRSTTKRYT